MFRYFLAAAMLLAAACGAQSLKRRGSLGIAFYQRTPDSIVQLINYKQGAVVQYVIAGSTAANMGLQRNDIILYVNGTKVVAPGDILLAVKSLRADDKVDVQVVRKNGVVKLTGTALAKPRETGTNVVYGEFAYKNGVVRTILKTPLNGKPSGTVYFLQGLPCYSMDNFKEADITKRAIDAMVDRGFAVYRMEKADLGDNMNMPPCETMGYDEELEMYMAGYKNLLTLKDVDTTRIFLFGHSMGGITAPLIAQKFQPKGVIVYGTVFKPWMDYLFDAYLMQSQYYGEDLATLRTQVESMKPHIYDYFYGNKCAADICKTKAGQFAMESVLGYDKKTGLAASGRSPLCHKELNRHNMAAAWKNTTSHVLAVYGECDIAAIQPDDHLALVNYVNSVRPGRGTFWQASGTTHTFEEIGTMQEFIKWQADQEGFNKYAATHFNYKVFDHVCDWMNSRDDSNGGLPSKK